MMLHGFMLIPWIKVLKLTLQMGGLLQKDKFPNLASTDVITSSLKAVPLSHARLRRAAGNPLHPLERP